MINWKEQSEGDFVAIEGDYMLRVEDMGEHWWWCTYFKDEQIDTGGEYWDEVSKANAEIAMIKHSKFLNNK